MKNPLTLTKGFGWIAMSCTPKGLSGHSGRQGLFAYPTMSLSAHDKSLEKIWQEKEFGAG
jgi:hypothetical protein